MVFVKDASDAAFEIRRHLPDLKSGILLSLRDCVPHR
jgi:hypothetical protein